MKRQGGFVALAVLIVLALACAAAVYFKNAYDTEHDQRVRIEANLVTANAATTACNASIASLETAALQAQIAASAARAEAKAAARKRAARADRELSTPATVPGNDCKSAQDRVHRILSERAKP